MKPKRIRWQKISDEELLELRFCDLPVKLEGTWLKKKIAQLHEELEARGISFRPPFWLSNEWFSPDDCPGIAIPFYLAHPRLMKLEYNQMLEVEGGTERECMRLLRHEAGHAIDTAYGLHRRKRWRELFGRFSSPYPDTYCPKPHSRKHVVHLKGWYAQAHPAEDFAETFAVWLSPRSRWKKVYSDWPALEKLEYVDTLMNSLSSASRHNKRRKPVDPISSLTTTLAEHYREKRAHYAGNSADFYDRDLFKVFSDNARYKKNLTAARFLISIRPRAREIVCRWTGTYPYALDQVLGELIARCRERKLRLMYSRTNTEQQVLIMLSVRMMNMIHAGRFHFPL